jgi:hypothetical protein
VVVGNFTGGGPVPAPVAESLLGAATFEECVALSHLDPPFSFEFEGGPISIYNNDFNPDDNTPGPDGRNPTFRLTRVGCGDTDRF